MGGCSSSRFQHGRKTRPREAKQIDRERERQSEREGELWQLGNVQVSFH